MKNTIYLDYGWFSGETPLTDSDRNNYILTLKDHGITQQFCDIGVIKEDGTLLPEGYSKLHQWINICHKVDSQQQVIPVLNYGNRKHSNVIGTHEFRHNLNRTIYQLTNAFDIDGIHLDIEGFINNDIQLIALLGTIRKSLDPNFWSLSISTPVTVWDNQMLSMIADIVDQVNPMIYDVMGWGSWVETEEQYGQYFSQAIDRYCNIIGTSCEIVPTLPAYELKIADDKTIYHDPKVETMAAGINALNNALNNGNEISGAGIFWGPHYMGLHPKTYNPTQDQEVWKSQWLK